jgi:hypothetical protein
MTLLILAITALGTTIPCLLVWAADARRRGG